MPRDDDNLWDLSFLQPRSLMSAARDWWTARSENAAAYKEADRWVKGLGQERLDEILEGVSLPNYLFSSAHTYSKEEELCSPREALKCNSPTNGLITVKHRLVLD